jgi:hypothetical protein
MRLLSDVSTHLGDYSARKWQRLVTVVESVVLFARHVFDTLPEYAKCQEDGGKGQTASETDLQKHLFEWLRSRFFEESIYEFTPLAGGRVDTGLLFPECRIPIEIKHEFTSVSREHVRDNYLTQADMYATATDRVSFLLILDLRASHAQAHRKRAAEARREGSAFQATSLYTVDEAFWVDALPVDAQLSNARPKAVIVGAIPGNRPNPSSTTRYSVRPRMPRTQRQSARARNVAQEDDMDEVE